MGSASRAPKRRRPTGSTIRHHRQVWRSSYTGSMNGIMHDATDKAPALLGPARYDVLQHRRALQLRQRRRGRADAGGLQRWLALEVACYHGRVHDTLGRTPAAVWAEKAAADGAPVAVTNETAFLVAWDPPVQAVHHRAQRRCQVRPSQVTRDEQPHAARDVKAHAARRDDTAVVDVGGRHATD